MISVASASVADNFAVDLRAAAQSVFVALYDQRSRTLTDNKSAALFIKRNGGAVFVGALRQSLAVGKARNGKRGDRRFDAARNNCVGIPARDGAVGFADRTRAAGAGSGDRDTRSVCFELNGNVACRHIADHFRNKERGNASPAAVQKVIVFGHKGIKTADTGAEVNAEALLFDLAFDGAVLNRLTRRRYGKLNKAVVFARNRFFHKSGGIKILYFRRKFHLIFSGIKAGNLVDSVHAVAQILAKGLGGKPDRRDRADAGNDNSFHSVFSQI